MRVYKLQHFEGNQAEIAYKCEPLPFENTILQRQ